MADLGVTWLGLKLRSPFVVAASPISQDPAAARQAAANGAGAIVMHSLFEEQLAEEQMAVHRLLDSQMDRNAEASSYMPDTLFALNGEGYLAELAALRAAVDVPVVASLNGTTPGGWTLYARRLADAGADALELNLYDIATQALKSSDAIERRQLALVEFGRLSRVDPRRGQAKSVLHCAARFRAPTGGGGRARGHGVQPLIRTAGRP